MIEVSCNNNKKPLSLSIHSFCFNNKYHFREISSKIKKRAFGNFSKGYIFNVNAQYFLLWGT